MTTDDLSRLRGLTYAEIASIMARWDSSVLVDLLNDRSIKVGDTAASLLASRHETELLSNAWESGRITTRNGKVRLINTLSKFGLSFPKSLDIFRSLLDDRSDDVVDCALFGIVMFRDRGTVRAVRERLARTSIGAKRREKMSKAIRALEAENPALYSPGFRDPAGVWKKLDSDRP